MKTTGIFIRISGFILISAIFSFCRTGKNSSENDILSQLSPNEKNELNAFFTEFSEVFTDTFSKGNLNDGIKIKFAVNHLYRANDKAIEYSEGGTYASVNQTAVESEAHRVFNSGISKHQTIDEIVYETGKYSIPRADGEMYRFSKVERLLDNGKNEFSAIVQIYTASSGWTGDINASPDDWKKDDDVPLKDTKIRALLDKISENGKSRYILTEYCLFEN